MADVCQRCSKKSYDFVTIKVCRNCYITLEDKILGKLSL